MFFIPGPVIAALTFPGVIIHEAGHLFFCRLFKLQVFDVCFFGMHAFPSTTDLSHLWADAPRLAKKGNLLAIVSLPLAAVLVVLNYARVIWADLGYGIAVGVLGPIAIFKALAR